MADFWIKVEKSTPDKAEIFEMAAMLDIDPDAVLGKLIRVWSWVDSNSSDGHIKSVTHVLINRVTNCGGFSEAMKEVGWLLENEIPNFDRHLGENAKKRSKDAERKRKSRTLSTTGHTESVTEKGLDKSREDKIRVEINKDTLPAKANDALEVFTYWKDVMRKSNSSLFNAKRERAVKARLKEGYTVEQIKSAILGCSLTDHNMGKNDSGKKYDDLELICRDGTQVERFANNSQGGGGGQNTDLLSHASLSGKDAVSDALNNIHDTDW